jgi:hypothetical protein
MQTPLLELEGTAEEIRAQLPDFEGRRIHVTIHPVESREETIPETPRSLSITEKILARVQAMPPEERAKMPSDLAEQHNHYIYGWPKK